MRLIGTIFSFHRLNRKLWGAGEAGLTARRVEALVDLKTDRLLRLLDLFARDAYSDAFSSG
jgi:hypothetical protein